MAFIVNPRSMLKNGISVRMMYFSGVDCSGLSAMLPRPDVLVALQIAFKWAGGRGARRGCILPDSGVFAQPFLKLSKIKKDNSNLRVTEKGQKTRSTSWCV